MKRKHKTRIPPETRGSWLPQIRYASSSQSTVVMCCLLEGRKKTRDLSGLTSFTSIEEPTYEHQPHIRPKTKCPQQQGVRLFDNCSNSIQYCLFYSICKLTRKLLLRVLASVVRACLAFLCWFFNASKRSEAAVRPLRSLVFSRPSSKQHITTVD